MQVIGVEGGGKRGSMAGLTLIVVDAPLQQGLSEVNWNRRMK